MPQLELNPHLHPAAFDARLKETFLGMAHIAGTGPEGRTCRECRYWHLWERRTGYQPDPAKAVSPGFYSNADKATAGQLKPAKCNYPLPHKANRKFPHWAKACRLFDPAESPPPIDRPLTSGAE